MRALSQTSPLNKRSADPRCFDHERLNHRIEREAKGALLGGWAKALRIEVFHTDTPFLLAMLPPGAFIGLGMMLALKYLIDEKRKRRAAERSVQEGLPEKAV